MGRSPCCDKLGLKKGPWTPEEDQKLLAYIEEHGHGNWRALPTKAGLQRCGKSCRLRWTNYLRPDIKRGKFSFQEEQTIIQLHALLGNRWSAIATHLPKRTDNEIKNYWNTHLKKRLAKMGIDPVTHKPKNDALVVVVEVGQQSKNAANLSHMAQWESARLEAEARLVRQSKVLRLSNNSSNDNNNNNNDTTSSFVPSSPDLHINDHSQIVPSVSLAPLSSSSSTSVHHYISMIATVAGAGVGVGTSTSTTPRCLDILKAWHGVWPNMSTTINNEEGIIGIGMGSSGIGGAVGVGIESPTSTLNFSENAPPVVSTMGTGAVIEFLGHNGQEDNHHHHQHHEEVVKKEGGHHQNEWKRAFEINSLSFSPSSGGFNDINVAISMDHGAVSGGELGGGDDDDDDYDDEHHDHSQSFMEGFTELLLSTKTTISSDKSGPEEGKKGDDDDDDDNNNDNSSGGTGGNGSRDYYEDNKTYWNSILNLVNSSPSHSPMF